MQPSVFFQGMNGSAFPIAVAHGEGRASFTTDSPSSHSLDSRKTQDAQMGHDFAYGNLAPVRYVDNQSAGADDELSR